MANQVKFYKVNGLTKSGLTVGGIYFDKTTGIIHVATSATTTDEFGVGVKSATLVNNVLEIVNQDGEKFSVDFKDIASASSVVAALNTKLNIGTNADVAGTQSYYGLKKDIAAQAAADKAAWEAYADQAEADAIAAAKVKDVDTTATNGVNLSVDTAGKLDVTVTPGSVVANNAYVVTGGVVYTAIEGAKNALLGTEEEATAEEATIAGAKAYADSVRSNLMEMIEQKNVDAEGDTLVSATAADNKVTVAATQELSGAVALAKSALQPGALDEDIAAAKTVVTEKADGHVTVTKSAGTDGNDVYTIAENDIASAQALSGVDGRVAAIEAVMGGDDADTAINKVSEIITFLNGIEEGTVAKDTFDAVTAHGTAITNLQNNTVNGKKISEDPVLAGSDVLLTGYTEQAASALNATDSINVALGKLEARVDAAAAGGVQSVGGKAGAITLDTDATGEGKVKFAISEAGEISATVNIGATAAQGAKADRAIRSVNFLEGSEYIYIDLSEDVFDGKADAELNVAKDIEQVSATSKELADAYAVKTYVDSQVTSALEWAEFN